MYKVAFFDKNGRKCTIYGLAESFTGGDDFIDRSFENLNRARRYSKAFVRRYPQVAAEIYEDDTQVETIQNDEYWQYVKNKDKKWQETHGKMTAVSNYIFYSLIVVVGMLLTAIIHLMGVYELPFLLKLVATPFLMITFWKVSSYLFARYF